MSVMYGVIGALIALLVGLAAYFSQRSREKAAAEEPAPIDGGRFGCLVVVLAFLVWIVLIIQNNS